MLVSTRVGNGQFGGGRQKKSGGRRHLMAAFFEFWRPAARWPSNSGGDSDVSRKKL